MFAIHADRPVLVQQEDRRAVRTPYSEVVLVDGAPMTGHNISASGISVLLSPSLTPGDVVRVTLAGTPGSVDEVASQARVSRLESRPEGIVVGLQFIG